MNFKKQKAQCKLKTDPVPSTLSSVCPATCSFGDFLLPWSPAKEEGEKPRV